MAWTLWPNNCPLCAAFSMRARRCELTTKCTCSWFRKVHVVPWGPLRNTPVFLLSTWSDTLLLIKKKKKKRSSISWGCSHKGHRVGGDVAVTGSGRFLGCLWCGAQLGRLGSVAAAGSSWGKTGFLLWSSWSASVMNLHARVCSR